MDTDQYRERVITTSSAASPDIQEAGRQRASTPGRNLPKNVVDLQLQGPILAVASIKNALAPKGILNIDEIDPPLRTAEANLAGEERLFEDMSPANHGSCIFPTTRKAKPKFPPSPSWLV